MLQHKTSRIASASNLSMDKLLIEPKLSFDSFIEPHPPKTSKSPVQSPRTKLLLRESNFFKELRKNSAFENKTKFNTENFRMKPSENDKSLLENLLNSYPVEGPISRLCKYEKTLPPISSRENVPLKYNIENDPKSTDVTNKISEIIVKNDLGKFETHSKSFVETGDKYHEKKSDTTIQLAIILPSGVRINDNFEVNTKIKEVIKKVLDKANELHMNANNCYLIQMPNEVINDINRTLHEYNIKNRSSFRLISNNRQNS